MATGRFAPGVTLVALRAWSESLEKLETGLVNQPLDTIVERIRREEKLGSFAPEFVSSGEKWSLALVGPKTSLKTILDCLSCNETNRVEDETVAYCFAALVPFTHDKSLQHSVPGSVHVIMASLNDGDAFSSRENIDAIAQLDVSTSFSQVGSLVRVCIPSDKFARMKDMFSQRGSSRVASEFVPNVQAHLSLVRSTLSDGSASDEDAIRTVRSAVLCRLCEWFANAAFSSLDGRQTADPPPVPYSLLKRQVNPLSLLAKGLTQSKKKDAESNHQEVLHLLRWTLKQNELRFPGQFHDIRSIYLGELGNYLEPGQEQAEVLIESIAIDELLIREVEQAGQSMDAEERQLRATQVQDPIEGEQITQRLRDLDAAKRKKANDLLTLRRTRMSNIRHLLEETFAKAPEGHTLIRRHVDTALRLFQELLAFDEKMDSSRRSGSSNEYVKDLQFASIFYQVAYKYDPANLKYVEEARKCLREVLRLRADRVKTNPDEFAWEFCTVASLSKTLAEHEREDWKCVKEDYAVIVEKIVPPAAAHRGELPKNIHLSAIYGDYARVLMQTQDYWAAAMAMQETIKVIADGKKGYLNLETANNFEQLARIYYLAQQQLELHVNAIVRSEREIVDMVETVIANVDRDQRMKAVMADWKGGEGHPVELVNFIAPSDRPPSSRKGASTTTKASSKEKSSPATATTQDSSKRQLGGGGMDNEPILTMRQLTGIHDLTLQAGLEEIIPTARQLTGLHDLQEPSVQDDWPAGLEASIPTIRQPSGLHDPQEPQQAFANTLGEETKHQDQDDDDGEGNGDVSSDARTSGEDDDEGDRSTVRYRDSFHTMNDVIGEDGGTAQGSTSLMNRAIQPMPAINLNQFDGSLNIPRQTMHEAFEKVARTCEEWLNQVRLQLALLKSLHDYNKERFCTFKETSAKIYKKLAEIKLLNWEIARLTREYEHGVEAGWLQVRKDDCGDPRELQRALDLIELSYHIASLHKQAGNVEASLELFRTALQGRLQLVAPDEMALADLDTLAREYTKHKRFDQAIFLFATAARLFDELGKEEFVGRCLCNQAMATESKGDLARAASLYEQGIAKLHDPKLAKDRLVGLNKLFACYTNMSNWTKATAYGQEILAELEGSDDPTQMIEFRLEFCRMLVKAKRLEEAAEQCALLQDVVSPDSPFFIRLLEVQISTNTITKEKLIEAENHFIKVLDDLREKNRTAEMVKLSVETFLPVLLERASAEIKSRKFKQGKALCLEVIDIINYLSADVHLDLQYKAMISVRHAKAHLLMRDLHKAHEYYHTAFSLYSVLYGGDVTSPVLVGLSAEMDQIRDRIEAFAGEEELEEEDDIDDDDDDDDLEENEDQEDDDDEDDYETYGDSGEEEEGEGDEEYGDDSLPTEDQYSGSQRTGEEADEDDDEDVSHDQSKPKPQVEGVQKRSLSEMLASLGISKSDAQLFHEEQD